VTIRCFYSCDGCGLKDQGVDVPARVGDDDVVVWMEQTVRLLVQDHKRRRVGCHPKSLQEIRIPMAGADRIGGPTIQ